MSWLQIVPKLNLEGTSLQLARNCEFVKSGNGELTLKLNKAHLSIFSDQAEHQLQQAVSSYLGKEQNLIITTTKSILEKTKAHTEQQHKNQQQQLAEQAIKNDPHVIELQKMFDANICNISIK